MVNIEAQKVKDLRANQKNAKLRNDSYLSGIMGNQRLTFSEYKDYIGIIPPQNVKGYLLYY